ncbi:type IV pilus biogenesis protein PilM [Pseudogracilibacillus auburnensis]|uniref:type IV pilus biogenesis protein PilM n=1 Tax=Pseudogracilibacillus auburnensis TaxID=1494959 RepID=UPI001A96EFEE|nr:pilus assembly protein PilM [Pseudogracilibacillus auburnensis]MBO1005598.1 pilus assembly protein PilM [Pseudogracilibacillus auburnensis]
MALQFLTRQNKVANLVFTDQAIRYIELAPGQKLEINKMAEKIMGPGKITNGKIVDFPSLRIILEQCVEEWGLKRKQVRFHIPDLHIVVRQVSIPQDIREDELQGYLFLEMGSTIHLPFDEPIFDSVMLPNAGKERNILLIAAPEDVVHSYTTLLNEVKLRPVAADIAPLSLYRLCYHFNQADSEDHVMILNMHDTLLTISIFHQHIPIFMRPVKIQESPVHILDVEEVDNPIYLLEDTFREIEKVMNFYAYSLNQGTAEISQILLSGDHPQLTAIHDHLSERFVTNIDYVRTNIGEQSISPAFATVLGLAMKEVGK